jgi:hypothetical protein
MGTRHVEESLHELDSISEHDCDEEVESGTWLEEMAEEVVGHPHDAPNQIDLHRLSRSSVKCHVSEHSYDGQSQGLLLHNWGHACAAALAWLTATCMGTLRSVWTLVMLYRGRTR